MKIGILQCGHAREKIAEKYGDYTDMFQRLLSGNGFEFQTFDVVDMDFPASVTDADGWLLTGSRHGAYEDHAFIKPLETFVQGAYNQGVVMVGICFGHQIIAQALGGKVVKFEGGWAIGHQQYDFDETGPLSLNAWHQDQVVRRPAGARVIASHPFCENAVLQYGDLIYTVQPHPEFSKEIFADFVTLLRPTGDYPLDRIDAALAKSDLPISDRALAGQISAFFKRAGAGIAG